MQFTVDATEYVQGDMGSGKMIASFKNLSGQIIPASLIAGQIQFGRPGQPMPDVYIVPFCFRATADTAPDGSQSFQITKAAVCASGMFFGEGAEPFTVSSNIDLRCSHTVAKNNGWM